MAISPKIKKLLKKGGYLAGKDKNGQSLKLTNSKRGGIAVGAKHGTEGGIKGTVGTEAKPIEFEGEEIIITAPAVKDNTRREFNGKMMTNREILSDINKSGGGVAFADGGEVPGKIRAAKGKTYKVGGKPMTAQQVVEYCGCGCAHEADEMDKGGQTGGGNSEYKYSWGSWSARIWESPVSGWRWEINDTTGSHNRITNHIDIKLSTPKEAERDMWRTIGERIGHYPQKKFAEGGSVSRQDALDLVKNINPLPPAFAMYKNAEPGELLNYIQDQAVGFVNGRQDVDYPPAYQTVVKLLGKDVVLACVQALDKYEKEMLLKAWKGRIVPKELRDAVKQTLADGGTITNEDEPINRDEIKADLALGGLLDHRARDYKLLKSTVDYPGESYAAGGPTETRYQIKNNHGGYYSRLGGSEHFNPVADFGLLYDQDEAEDVVEWLQKRGYTGLAIVPYEPQHEMAYAAGGHTDSEMTMPEFTQLIKKISPFTPGQQLNYLANLFRSEEKEAAIEIVQRLSGIIDKMPKTYDTEDQETSDKIVYLHYFHGGSDWYIIEKDMEPEQLQAFGYVILNGDDINAEWGYVSIEELKRMKVIELDFYFNPIKFGDLKKKWDWEENAINDQSEIQKAIDSLSAFERKSVVANLSEKDYKKYLKNEHINFHSENIYILAKATGNQTLRNAAAVLVDEQDKAGSLTSELRKLRELLSSIIQMGQPGNKPETQKPATSYANAYELNKAIEKLLDSKPNNADFTADEKAFLKYYSGYGGLEKFGATGKGLLYEYFTPSLIAEKMWGLAYKYGFKGGPVLEPSAGIGEFIKYAPEQHLVVAHEINKYSARICKILYPDITISTKYFEEVFIKNNDSIKGKIGLLPKYKLVIGNPPYGEFGGKWAGMGEKSYTRAGNYIDYFIFRGLDLLEPGGLLIFIVGAEVASGGKCFLSQQMNKCKDEIMEKSDLLDAYRLPNGVFERTDVLSDIIVLRKK